MKVSDRDQNVNNVRIIGCVLMNEFLIWNDDNDEDDDDLE